MPTPFKTLATPSGLTIAYESFGSDDAEPVIFAHGGGQTRHAWKGAAKALGKKDWRAIAIDLRGHGDSDWAKNGDYDLAAVGGDLVALAEYFGAIRSPHIVGASMGGMGAMMAAGLLRPGIFATLTLVDITPHMDEAGVKKIVGFMSEHAEEGFATLEDAADAIAGYLPHRPRPKDLGGLQKNLRQRDNGRWYWHWDPAFIMRSEERREKGNFSHLEDAVRNIAIPVHLVRGRMSELVSEEAVVKFREMVPHADYTDVEGARHMVAGDKNDIFLDAVEAFLTKHAAGR